MSSEQQASADEIQVNLPDGSVKVLPQGTTLHGLAMEISPGLARQAIAGKDGDGNWIDLRAPLADGMTVKIIKDKDPEAVEVIRHSAEHIMADAVKRLFPGATVDAGRSDHSEKFQYDFGFERPFTPEDLEKIEAEMAKIIKEDAEFERIEVSRDEALETFEKMGETWKVKRIEAIPKSETITVFKHGQFMDLCRGPHVDHAGRVKAFMLTDTSSVYWKGDESNPVLYRIYGTAFGKKKELEEYKTLLEEAAKRDHRRLGRELDLFSLQPDDVGSGLVLWHPKGAAVRRVIEDFSRAQHDERGYQWVYTPHVGKSTLWETSGHLGFYADGMYPPMEFTDDAETYYAKPMNCPFHIKIFASRRRSYRELPVRLAELGTVYRYERSGVMHGLLRARGFTQDDSHIFCAREQVEDEIVEVVDFILSMLRQFGFRDFKAFVSTKPDKAVGEDADWEMATEALVRAAERANLEYDYDYGGGAFYGPKIDIKVKDAIGREWQLSTVQFDFNEPERFDLTYVGADNAPHRPFMVHRALLGSIERFFGILVEHYAGAFPLWLAPIQARVVPISDDQPEIVSHGVRMVEALRAAGLRAEMDESQGKLGAKIRAGQLEKIPYQLVVGKNEVAEGGVSPRNREGKDLGCMSIEAFIERARQEMDDEKKTN